jgi:hypothetical protein
MMETKFSTPEILLNTEDFSSIRLSTQDMTYPQRCFRQTVLPNASGRNLNYYVMDSNIQNSTMVAITFPADFWTNLAWCQETLVLQLDDHIWFVGPSDEFMLHSLSLLQM